MMLALKLILYVISTLSLLWAGLIFVGPTVIKSLVSTYSNNQFVASNVIVTPRLDIKISRLDFELRGDKNKIQRRGFSRSVDIVWSFSKYRPFVDVKVGPTLIDNIFSVDNFVIQTPSFASVDFEEIILNAAVHNLETQSFGNAEKLNLEATYQTNTGLIRDLSFYISSVDFSSRKSLVSEGLFAKITELNPKVPLYDQPIMLEVSADLFDSIKYNANFRNLAGLLIVDGDEIEFKIDAQPYNFMKMERSLSQLKIKGKYSKTAFLENLQIQMLDKSSGVVFQNNLSISLNASNIKADAYDLQILGSVKPFDLVINEKFVGQIPESKFQINMDINTSELEINAIPEVEIKNLYGPNIGGNGQLRAKINDLEKLFNCLELECILLNLDFDYKFTEGQQWFRGSSACYSPPCNLSNMSHTFSTSNTAEIFSVINQSRFLNPLYSIYLYSFIIAGDKVGNGHEITIN